MGPFNIGFLSFRIVLAGRVHHLDHLDFPLNNNILSPFHQSQNTQHQSSMCIFIEHIVPIANYTLIFPCIHDKKPIRFISVETPFPNSTLRGTLQTISCPHHSIDRRGFVPNLTPASKFVRKYRKLVGFLPEIRDSLRW